LSDAQEISEVFPYFGGDFSCQHSAKRSGLHCISPDWFLIDVMYFAWWLPAMTAVKMRIVFAHAFEWLDQRMLTAIKATLLLAIITAFLPLVFRIGLRHFSRQKHS
jgi:hypothetical protein